MMEEGGCIGCNQAHEQRLSAERSLTEEAKDKAAKNNKPYAVTHENTILPFEDCIKNNIPYKALFTP